MLSLVRSVFCKQLKRHLNQFKNYLAHTYWRCCFRLHLTLGHKKKPWNLAVWIHNAFSGQNKNKFLVTAVDVSRLACSKHPLCEDPKKTTVRNREELGIDLKECNPCAIDQKGFLEAIKMLTAVKHQTLCSSGSRNKDENNQSALTPSLSGLPELFFPLQTPTKSTVIIYYKCRKNNKKVGNGALLHHCRFSFWLNLFVSVKGPK